MPTTRELAIPIPHEEIAAFCRKWGIKRLSFFDVNGAGSVEVANDGSGSAHIRNVKHDVHIGNKGSGSVEVSDVGGNFSVGNKGGGSITWDRIAGHVDVPERFRR